MVALSEPNRKSAFSIIKTSRDWITETVLYYRKLGFYEKYSHLPEDKLVEKIKKLYRFRSEEEFTYSKLLLLLARDKKRVWYCDAELCWDQQYVKFVQEWGKISCGTFTPKKITEFRDKEKVKITFTHNKKFFEIYACNYGEWLDLGVLGWINEIIQDTKYHFWNIVPDSQEVCIVCLTDEQKDQLEKDLELTFEQPDEHKYHPNSEDVC